MLALQPDLFAFGDEIGPLRIVHFSVPSAPLMVIVVVDNVAAGPAVDATRMSLDVTVEECFRLARAMTLKNATAGLPDFIANAGGVICAAVEYAGGSEATAFAAIEEKINRNIDEVVKNSSARHISSRLAAMEIVMERLRQ
jgi:glutamate dehydrogenase/leucine dehydrogenase